MKNLMRRVLLGTAAALLGLTVAFPSFAEMITVTDIAGRSVDVKKGVERVILGEGRMMYTVAVLDRENPFQRIIGWKDDLIKYDPDAFRKFEALDKDATSKIVNFGSPYAGDFSVENAIANKADLVMLDLGNYFKAEESGVIENLEKAGIPVLFIDYRINPTENTVPSLQLMARIFDREAEAQEFVDFYIQQMRKVTLPVSQIPSDERPLVFIENAPGWDKEYCCSTYGPYNFGRLVDQAGGINWGTQRFSTYQGEASLEVLISSDPDIIIGTGANWAEDRPEVSSVLLGYEASPESVDARLKALSDRNGFKTLKAVKDKRFHSIYHQFYNSPYHFVALQAMAKWIHPDTFPDLDPDATFTELHERFLPFTTSGQFWASLK